MLTNRGSQRADLPVVQHDRAPDGRQGVAAFHRQEATLDQAPIMGAGCQFLTHVAAFRPRYPMEVIEICFQQQGLFGFAVDGVGQTEFDTMLVVGIGPDSRFLRRAISAPSRLRQAWVGGGMSCRHSGIVPASLYGQVGGRDLDIRTEAKAR